MKRLTFTWLLLLCFLFPLQALAYQTDFTGIWEFTDENDNTFLVQVSEDFSVISTYSRGENSVVPLEGYWHQSGDDLIILYNNGWVDVVKKDKGTYTKTAYAPGIAMGKKGGKTSAVFKTGRTDLWGPVSEEAFLGYWKLLDENKKVFYLNIKEDHTAQSTYPDGSNGVFGERGTWRFEHNRIMVVYDSGWIDFIIKSDAGLNKYSFAPGQRISGKPNNTSDVARASQEELKRK